MQYSGGSNSSCLDTRVNADSAMYWYCTCRRMRCILTESMLTALVTVLWIAFTLQVIII